MQRLRILAIKIWRITCADALTVCGGLSLLLFVEDSAFNLALLLTVVSLVIYYYAALRDFGELIAYPSEPFVWRVFFTRIWKITLANVLWIFSAITYLFFVAGIHLLLLILLTIAGFTLLYINAYRTMAIEATTSATDTNADAESVR